MRAKHVVVLSSDALLRERLRCDLSSQEMEIIGIDPQYEHAPWRLYTLQPDTIILDVSDNTLDRYLTVAQIFRVCPRSRVCCLDPKTNGMTLYVNRLPIAAHFHDLLGAIHWEG